MTDTDTPPVATRERARLLAEYRPTMSSDVLHSWAQDMVAAFAAEQAPEREGWQPIATAPRDGSVFDVWIPSFAEPGKGYRVADLQMCPDGRLYRHSRLNLAELARWPTHWMPLPTAPRPSPAASTGEQ